MPSDAKKSKIGRSLVILVSIAIALCAALIVYLFYSSTFSGPIAVDHSRWTEFGDFVGGTLNPVFGLLSLIAILVALLLHSKELSHSSSALEEQSEHTVGRMNREKSCGLIFF